MYRLVAALLLLTLPSCAQPLVLPEAPSPQQQQPATTQPLPAALPDAPSVSRYVEPSTQTPSPTTPANPPHSKAPWRNVEFLQPADPIAVLETGHRSPTPCSFDDATDNSLTCIVYPPYFAPRRIIYPLHGINAVYTEEQTFEPPASHVLIAAAIGATLGGLISSNCSPGVIAAAVAIGAGVGATIVLAPTPTPFPPSPRIRRHLIYQAP